MKVYRTQHTEYMVKITKNEFKPEKNELALVEGVDHRSLVHGALNTRPDEVDTELGGSVFLPRRSGERAGVRGFLGGRVIPAACT